MSTKLKTHVVDTNSVESRIKMMQTKCEEAKQRADLIMKYRRDKLAINNEKAFEVHMEMNAKNELIKKERLDKVTNKLCYLLLCKKKYNNIRQQIVHRLNERQIDMLRRYANNIQNIKQVEEKRTNEIKEQHERKLSFVQSLIVLYFLISRMGGGSIGLIRVWNMGRR